MIQMNDPACQVQQFVLYNDFDSATYTGSAVSIVGNDLVLLDISMPATHQFRVEATHTGLVISEMVSFTVTVWCNNILNKLMVGPIESLNHVAGTGQVDIIHHLLLFTDSTSQCTHNGGISIVDPSTAPRDISSSPVFFDGITGMIKLDKDVPFSQPSYSVWVTQFNYHGLEESVRIDISMTRCQLLHTEPELIVLTNQDLAPNALIEFLLDGKFNNEIACQPYGEQYLLMEAGTDTDLSDHRDLIQVNQTHLRVSQNVLIDGFKFSLISKSDLSQSNLMNFEVSLKEDEELPTTIEIVDQILNTPPTWKSPHVSEISLDLIKYPNGSYGGDSFYVQEGQQSPVSWQGELFEYMSPQVLDEDGDPVSISFLQEPQDSWIQVQKRASDFKITVYRDLIQQPYQGNLQVVITDGKQNTPLVQSSVSITVNFQEEAPVVYDEPLTVQEQLIQEQLGQLNDFNSTDEDDPILDLVEIQEELDSILNDYSEEISATEKDEMIKKKKQEIKLVQDQVVLKASGGSKLPDGGYTFPGVDITKFQGGNLKAVKPPQMNITFISAISKVSIKFNQKMVYPTVINQTFYNTILKAKLQSFEDKDVSWDGSFVEDHNEQKRELTEADPSRKMAFNLKVEKHDSQELKIGINFDYPKEISTNFDMDSMYFTVIQPSVFRSQDSLQQVELESLQGSDSHFIKKVPPTIDEQSANDIASSTQKSALAVAGTSIVSFFVSLLVGGSLQQMFGMVRTLQVVILLSLININTPAHVLVFLQGCIMIATFDVFDAGPIYEVLFRFKETAPHNQHFEMFGIDNKNFIYNSGSVFPFLILISLTTLTSYILQMVARRFPQYHAMRIIGLKTYQDGRLQVWKYANQKLFLETFFDIFICLILHSLSWSTENGGFINYLKSGEDIFSTLLVLILLGLVIYLFVWSYMAIVQNFKQLGQPATSTKLQVLIETSKTNKKSAALFTYYFLLRRVISALFLVLMTQLPHFQCMAMIVMSMLSITYAAGSRPQKNGNYVEVFNEACIYVATVLMTSLLDPRPGFQLRESVGSGFIAVIGFNAGVNLLLTVYQSSKGFIEQYRQSQINKLIVKSEFKRKENRQKIMDRIPEQNEFYQNQIEEEDAVEYVRDWKNYRNWMIKSGIKFEHLDQEVKYQELLKKHQFLKKAQVQRLYSSIDFLARRQTTESIDDKKFEWNVKQHPSRKYVKSMIEAKNTDLDEKEEGNNKVGLKSKKKVRFEIANRYQKIVSDSKVLKLIAINEKDEEDTDNPVDTEIDMFSRENKLKLYAKNKSEIHANNLLRGLEGASSLSMKGDRQKEFDFLGELMKEVPHMKHLKHDQRKKLQKTIKRQAKVLINKGIDDNKEARPMELQKYERDVQFLLEEDFEDYGEELESQLTKAERLAPLEQFLKSHGVVNLTSGGENDYFQAVFQCLLRIKCVAHFLMGQLYQDIKEAEIVKHAQTLCLNACRLFSDVNGEQIKVLQDLKPSLDLAEFRKAIQKMYQISKGTDQDAGLLMAFVIDRLLLEVNHKCLSEKSQTGGHWFAKHMLIFKLNRQRLCKKGHVLLTKTSHFSYFKMPVFKSLKVGFEKLLKAYSIKDYCNDCKKYTDIRELCFFRGAPEMIVIIVLIVNDKKELLSFEDPTIPEVWDAKDYMQCEEGERFKKKYSLSAVVDVQGKTLKEAKYSAIVKRKNPQNMEETVWYKIHKNEREEVSLESVLTKSRAQVLIYEKMY